MMVEAGAKQITEADMVAAIKFAQPHLTNLSNCRKI
jgi:polyribonucleotide nucleotidyltransferase